MTKNEVTGRLDLHAVVVAQGDTIKNQGNEIGYVKALVVAIVVVLFIGFAGMFVATGAMMVDALNNKSASYLELRDEVFDQKNKIELLTNQIKMKQATNQSSAIPQAH